MAVDAAAATMQSPSGPASRRRGAPSFAGASTRPPSRWTARRVMDAPPTVCEVTVPALTAWLQLERGDLGLRFACGAAWHGRRRRRTVPPRGARGARGPGPVPACSRRLAAAGQPARDHRVRRHARLRVGRGPCGHARRRGAAARCRQRCIVGRRHAAALSRTGGHADAPCDGTSGPGPKPRRWWTPAISTAPPTATPHGRPSCGCHRGHGARCWRHATRRPSTITIASPPQ